MINDPKTIGAHSYLIERLDVFQCHDIARYYGPVLITLASLKERAPDKKLPTPDRIAHSMVAVSRELPREHVAFVINTCLGVVRRAQPNGAGWARITAPQTGVLMFEDIDMMQMLQLVWMVMEAHQIPDFFDAAPAASVGQPAA